MACCAEDLNSDKNVDVVVEEVEGGSVNFFQLPTEILRKVLSFCDTNALNKLRMTSSKMNELCKEMLRKKIKKFIPKIEVKLEGYKYSKGYRGCGELVDIKYRLYRLTISNLQFVLDMMKKPVEDKNCRYDCGNVVQDAIDFFKIIQELKDFPNAVYIYSIIPESYKQLKKLQRFALYGNIDSDWEILEYLVGKIPVEGNDDGGNDDDEDDDDDDDEKLMEKLAAEHLQEMYMDKGYFFTDDAYLEYLLRNTDI